MIEKEFTAKDESLAAVQAFAEEELEKADCPMKLMMQVSVAIEEVFVNIAHYAYDGEEGNMKLGIDFEGGVMTFRFTDSGMPFDPLAKRDPDITLSAEERQIGGLGIFMVKKTMDEVTYERKKGNNILTLKKNLWV